MSLLSSAAITFASEPVEAERIRVYALGVFRVLRDGVAVDARAWQSKKARDLLKILVSRRGRAMTREEIIGALWPDDGAGASNRLSVLLSTLRTILAPCADRGANGANGASGANGGCAIVADRYVVRLNLDVVTVDVELFAELAAHALARWHAHDDDALGLLETAEAAYGGDFCEEDTYDDWAVGVRDELRTLHLSVVRALVGAATAAGRTDQAVRGLLTLLRSDPYDESAHLELVELLHRARRLGDARRRYDAYEQRMQEIAVRPSPYPANC